MMKIKVYHHVQGAIFTTWELVKVIFIFPEGIWVKWSDGTFSMGEADTLLPSP